MMTTDQEWALWNAVGEGQLSEVRQVIEMEEGLDINHRFSESITAVHFAVLQGHKAIVAFLLEQGADINIATNSGISPLMSACSQGLVDIAQFLLQAGADVNALNKDQESVLLYLGKARLKKARISRGRGSLHGFYKICHSESQCQCGELVRMLVLAGADVNCQNLEGFTALMIFIISRHYMIAMFLLENGADPSLVTEEGHTALLMICKKGLSFDLVQRLITAGADVNQAKQPEGTTPLMAACLHCTFNARTLIAAGASVNATNARGETALRFALVNGSSDIVTHLLDVGATINKELILAVLIGDKSNIQTLVTRCSFPKAAETIENLRTDLDNLSRRFGIRIPHYVNHPLNTHLTALGISSVTPFIIALMSRTDLVLRYFVRNLFFHPLDMRLMTDYWKTGLSTSLQDDGLSPELLPLTSQPWSLKNLSFLCVSFLMGFDRERERRVKSCGLPELFQRKLLFRDQCAFVQPNRWSEFELIL